MIAIRKLLVRLMNDERGLTAVEYAVLGAIVVGVVGTAGRAFGVELSAAFAGLIP